MDQNFIEKSQKESTRQPKIIKRYCNRKLYDTEQSTYVVLKDIAKMIRNNEHVRVIDNETKNDITSSTFTQIIFACEKKATCSTPLDILKNIIMKGDGSLSNFLAEMGLFKAVKNENKNLNFKNLDKKETQTSSTLEERIANASSTTVHSILEESDGLPKLPSANKDIVY